MNRTIYCFITLLLLLSWSCKDNTQEFEKETGEYAENKWIESTMRKNYYWDKKIPQASALNYNLGAEAFFGALLYQKEDGKTRGETYYPYSYIEKKSSSVTKSYLGEEPSLGFEYQIYHITNLSRYALFVLYILPNSPTSDKDIKRGDWIYEINNQNITDGLIDQLNSGAEVKLGISNTIRPQVTRTVTVSAQLTEDDPVFLHKVMNSGTKKVAYLVYNHFTAGKDKDETFNNSLRKVFAEFKTINPDEFVLDLRYNGGGMVSCAQLLSSMLAPAEALGGVFCYMTDNKDKVTTLNLIKNNAENINLKNKRLFVITSTRTASASEAVINGLKPYMEDQLILVGEQTEGKNVGSVLYEDASYDWVMHPIICKISNKDHFSDYASGFLPTSGFQCSEPYDGLFDLGDPKEYILSRILAFVETGTPIVSLTARSIETSNTNIIPQGSSLDRKKTNGVVIDIE